MDKDNKNPNINNAYENINFKPEEEKEDSRNNFESQQEGNQGYQQGDNPGYQQEENQSDNRGYYQEQQVEKKVRIPAWVFVFLAAVIALDVICMLRFPKVIHDYKIYSTAEERIQNADTSQVIKDLTALAEKHPDSIPIQVKAVELAMENGYYDIAGYQIDTYLAGKSLSDNEYNKINSYFPKLDGYFATSDAANQIFKEASDQYTDDNSYYEKIHSDLTALLKDNTQDAASVYYYLGISESDITQSRNYMEQCYLLDPECFDVRGQLSIIYRRAGDFSKAKRLANEALGKDKTDSTALRAMATITMLEDDLEQGLSFARAAYNSYADGIYVRETYLIALTLTGDSEEAKRIQDEMTAAGETLEENTKQLLDGDITLEDYYIGE